MFVEFYQDSSKNRKFNLESLFEIEIFCTILNVFTVIFDQFNASLLNLISVF